MLARMMNHPSKRNADVRRRPGKAMCRTSMRIARYDDRDPPRDITFEVWNPWRGAYEREPTLHECLVQLDAIVRQLRLIRTRKQSDRTALIDVPPPADAGEWAELRVDVGPTWPYHTRSFDQHDWSEATGRAHAVDVICNEIGYVNSLALDLA
jgi:hypothetical protein